jgi:tetratricopeptide (TPR) repeat protein
MQESPPPAPEPPARQTAPEPKPTVHLYTAVDPDDDPYQCVYCGQPTERADQRCPHCGRSLLVAGPWQGTGWRNGLLFVCGLVLQAAIFQLLGPVFRIAGAQGYDISLAVLLTRLPLVTSFLGDFPNWSEAEAYRHLIAGVVRLILWIVLFFMLYTDMDAAHPLGVALALADFAWAGAGYSLGYVPPLAAGLNALFDVFVLSVSAVATASRAQARVRQRVEIDRELFGAAAMDKRGHKYRREGKWALAALHWQKAVILSPREPQYYKDLAAAQMRLGRYEKALRTLETGVYHAPGDEEFKTLMEAVRAKAEGE